jgi:hypothetical protein
MKSIIYFNLFIFSTDLILRYESDEIYSILINIYNNLKNISYNTIKDIIYYIKEKIYIADKLEDLIKDNSIEDNSIDNKSNNNSIDNNNSNKLFYLAITMIVISSGIIIYFYFNDDNTGMNDLLLKINELKPFRFIPTEDNDSLKNMILDESGYFMNIPVSPTDSNSTLRN